MGRRLNVNVIGYYMCVQGEVIDLHHYNMIVRKIFSVCVHLVTEFEEFHFNFYETDVM